MGETIGSSSNRIRCAPPSAHGLYSWRGYQRLVAVQQISYFQHFGGSAMEYSLAESMLFNKTLDV
ncbi:hypothetical protein ACMX2I_06965 [Bacillus sp. SW14]|uniref:hypothetical protein n=1 Tax=Bacillus sp. SW14 TaxID=3391618 RepID=UPI0039E519C6